jgi:hypothetical protein
VKVSEKNSFKHPPVAEARKGDWCLFIAQACRAAMTLVHSFFRDLSPESREPHHHIQSENGDQQRVHQHEME